MTAVGRVTARRWKISGLGRHECSATVVDTAGDSTVFTAGHCKATKLVGGVGK